MRKSITIDNFKSISPAMILDATIDKDEIFEVNIQNTIGGKGKSVYLNVNGVTVVRIQAPSENFRLNIEGDEI